MPLRKIPNRVIKIIDVKINDIFDAVKARLLGARGLDKTLFFTYNRSLSLPGIYEAALLEEGGSPDIDTLNSLMNTSKNYLDALKLKSINKIVNDLEKHIATGDASAESLEEVLKTSWQQITSNLETILNSEIQATKNMGLLAGIIKTNASFGIDDPVVAFIPVRDNNVCSECLTLHLLEDKITPRLWYLSEVSRGYHQRGEPFPSAHGLHPNCRCQMTTIMPGYGFKPGTGSVTYISRGFSAIEDQRKK